MSSSRLASCLFKFVFIWISTRRKMSYARLPYFVLQKTILRQKNPEWKSAFKLDFYLQLLLIEIILYIMKIFNIHKQAEITKKQYGHACRSHCLQNTAVVNKDNINMFAQYNCGLEAILLTELAQSQGWLVYLETPSNNPLRYAQSLTSSEY